VTVLEESELESFALLHDEGQIVRVGVGRSPDAVDPGDQLRGSSPSHRPVFLSLVFSAGDGHLYKDRAPGGALGELQSGRPFWRKNCADGVGGAVGDDEGDLLLADRNLRRLSCRCHCTCDCLARSEGRSKGNLSRFPWDDHPASLSSSQDKPTTGLNPTTTRLQD